jgi:membrane fusion protein (multidrug efflux system)
VSVGDYVKEGQDIVNLESLDPLKVDFRVPELAMSQVKNGQTLQVTLDAIPDRAYDGRSTRSTRSSTPNGRSIVIRAQVANRDGKLRPGMFARVRLFTSEARRLGARAPRSRSSPWATTSTSTRWSTARP